MLNCLKHYVSLHCDYIYQEHMLPENIYADTQRSLVADTQQCFHSPALSGRIINPERLRI